MTSFLKPTIEQITSLSKDAKLNIIRYRDHKNVLKSKDNIYRHRCKEVLKRKLKKYKLRQDGKEDQDIIDVSAIIISSLSIKSPGKQKDSVELELEQLRPKNYLYKMVKRKQTTLKTINKSSKSPDIIPITLDKNEVLHISPSTEEKQQKNAFKLLMDSRNKSIGTNSPGKEKQTEDIESQEIIEKKNLKVKRNLMLEKMAEQRGSLKKKEVEEQHETYIQKKMEKRAERLKNMILKKEPKSIKDEKPIISVLHKVRSPLDSIETEKNGKVTDKQKTLQLVSIFNECEDNMSTKKKVIPKEDVEFLKKLSPSLRKKESMLSYFKKVDKDTDSVDADSENDNVIIKVKLGCKHKRKGLKKKLTLNRNTASLCDIHNDSRDCIDLEVTELTETKTVETLEEDLGLTVSQNNSKERRKRKRNNKESIPCSDSPIVNNPDQIDRPRRNVKKPSKYNDDNYITSSDEEFHIFTPKKKKPQERNKLKPKLTDDLIVVVDDEKPKPNKMQQGKIEKAKKQPAKDMKLPKPLKLAPIFAKAQPDLAALEAKQKFLQSGVPEELKKLIPKQKDTYIIENSFPKVVHIQQLDTTFVTITELNLSEEIFCQELSVGLCEDIFCKILNLSSVNNSFSIPSKNNASIHCILQKLKESYPRFPIYRTYKLLKGKKKGEYQDNNIFAKLDNSVEILNCSIDMQTNNPEQLSWSDKYKPLSGNEIIGNFEAIKELKKWLITWTENDKKAKMNQNNSDSSDYYESEPDSRDSMKSNNNLLILSGPVGSGKTSSVYAVAAELSMKVIEVNASSKRTGKIMLQDLQEATQSHKVNRCTGSENSQKSQEVVEPPLEVIVKKRGRPKKSDTVTPKKLIKKKEKAEVTSSTFSQENVRAAMSLILIDDADIVFDQDDGFCSAIMQLVQSSKRPVILITGSLSLPHLQRFLQSNKVLKMRPLLPSMLGTWLDLMCLADSGSCWPGLGAKFLDYYKGDMRKTINSLQFYMGSNELVSGVEGNSQMESQNDIVKLITEDENSCMSWADRETESDRGFPSDTDSQCIWDILLYAHMHLHMRDCFRLFDVWWSIPKILSHTELNVDCKVDKNNTGKGMHNKKKKSSLESMSNVLDTISVCDYFNHRRPEREASITSDPWLESECNSVSELENFDYYDQKFETNNDISYDLVKGCIHTAQENIGIESRFNIEFPGMAVQRQRDRIVARHNNLTAYFSPQSSLDRKALALDYWSSCRTICRIEKTKTDSNSKRHNRFCHYLKSLNVLCRSESFDSLAKSLHPNEI